MDYTKFRELCTLNIGVNAFVVGKHGHSNVMNGTTIRNCAPNGFGSGVANQHSVLCVISELI